MPSEGGFVSKKKDIRQEQDWRDAEAYERTPLTFDETGPPRPARGDPSDETDWEEIYRDALGR